MAKIETLGVQLYTVASIMKGEEARRTTFAKLKEMGFDEVQTYSAVPPYEQYKAMLDEAGLKVAGTHEDFGWLCEDTQRTMDNHRILGTTNVGIGGFFADNYEDYFDFIEKANELCSVIGPQGFKFTYHHHNHEFAKFNGKRPIDLLIEKLDNRYTTFVIDTFWMQNAGCDVAQWIRDLKGRIDILHLKDTAMTPKNGCAFAEVGNGNMNWNAIIGAALDVGVKHFIVEQDQCPGNPLDSLQMSVDYLRANFM